MCPEKGVGSYHYPRKGVDIWTYTVVKWPYVQPATRPHHHHQSLHTLWMGGMGSRGGRVAVSFVAHYAMPTVPLCPQRDKLPGLDGRGWLFICWLTSGGSCKLARDSGRNVTAAGRDTLTIYGGQAV